MRGVYLLFLNIEEKIRRKIGSLGSIEFSPGLYVYVGSAQNGVETRLKRHFKKKKKLRWHIDYLLSSPKVYPLYAVVFKLPKKYECLFSALLASLGYERIRGFGSSDCRCPSHLYKIDNSSKILKLIKRKFSQNSTIFFTKENLFKSPKL